MQTSQCLSYRSLKKGGRAWRPSKPPEGGGEGGRGGGEEGGRGRQKAIVSPFLAVCLDAWLTLTIAVYPGS